MRISSIVWDTVQQDGERDNARLIANRLGYSKRPTSDNSPTPILHPGEVYRDDLRLSELRYG